MNSWFPRLTSAANTWEAQDSGAAGDTLTIEGAAVSVTAATNLDFEDARYADSAVFQVSAGTYTATFTFPITHAAVSVLGSEISLAEASPNMTLPITAAAVPFTGSSIVGVLTFAVVPGPTVPVLGKSIRLINSGGPPAAQGSVMARVYLLPSVTGLRKWADYLPVQYVATEDSDVNTYNDAGALGVNTISLEAWERAWEHYIPVYEVAGDDAKRWRYDDDGWVPIVEVESVEVG